MEVVFILVFGEVILDLHFKGSIRDKMMLTKISRF